MLIKNIGKSALFALIMAAMSVNTYASGDHAGGHDDDHKKDDHAHSGDHHDEDGHDKSGMFSKTKKIDGYDVSFHVMKDEDGSGHGGSHNFMIKVEKDGKALKDVVVNSKVVHPNNTAETKKLSLMGDWYMNGYNLNHDGKHQMMILFKTSDGKKHKGGVYYAQ